MVHDDPIDPQRTVEQPVDLERSTIGHSASESSNRSAETLEPTTTRSKASWSTIPGYEILQELGRGGMGVVYLARQSSLKRLVALKMIRGGGDASPEQIERFRVEGEAVARLQHPNIVQIFEVGDHEGDPFFALEYVDGGSLSAALAAGALAQTEAAEIIETLARAVHHAHQKSVVHRDLKPANVLLTSDRIPKVTDFGLAKRLEEGDSGQTRTGAVMGTPSYMAPEQAAGQVHKIGPTTDVYALGVMLYECITGQVPFKGDSILDTLEMVRSVDPIAPSRLRTGLPRDLETICLKAMAKEPHARYSSALGMAQDLERFRSGEPILGRRAGILQKFVRSVRRNKVAVMGAMALLVVVGTVAAALFTTRSSKELQSAEERVTQGLDQSTWDVEAANALEKDIDRLAMLDANRGQAARQKLTDRFTAAIQADLKKPRVVEADVPGLETRLAWLAARDPEQAKNLDKDLRARLRAWQPIVELVAPFANRADVFTNGTASFEADRIWSGTPFLPTRIPMTGTSKVEVDYVGDWYKSAQIGILFSYRVDSPFDLATGYTFLLRPAWPKDDPDAAPRTGVPPSFEAANGAATLEIHRDGTQLDVSTVRVRPGPIRMIAERNGERIAIQLNGNPVRSFDDSIPLPFVPRSTLGIICPPSSGVQRLVIYGQPLSAAASRLEQADEQFSRGKVVEAMASYETFARETNDPEAKAEALYKSGLCLLQLGRGPEAATIFEEVSTTTSNRWGVIATFQLCLYHLKNKQFDEADAAMTSIKVRYTNEMIQRYVPMAIRLEISTNVVGPSISWLVYDPTMIPQLESVVRFATILQLNPASVVLQRYALMRAYCLAGDYHKAQLLASETIESSLNPGTVPDGSFYWVIRWHSWASRLIGGVNNYNDVLSKISQIPLREGEDPDDRKRTFLPIRLENARNHAALKSWQPAEQELDRYLAEYPQPMATYIHYSQLYFMKGFLRLQANDPAGAQTAWKQGVAHQYLKTLPPGTSNASQLTSSRIALVESWVMECLTDSLTDEEAVEVLKMITHTLSTEEIANQLISILNFTPAIIRGAWTSPRGKEWARRLAFLDLTPNEYYWVAPRLLLYEKLRQELLGGAATADQDNILWSTIEQFSEAFRTGAITKSQAFQLALAWKGTTNLLGWGGIAPKLKPELRGPVAYALGVRYRKLNKPADAEMMFKTAAADAPADSPLKKLAEAELKKKPDGK